MAAVARVACMVLTLGVSRRRRSSLRGQQAAVRFAISGIQNPERAHVRERAVALGGHYQPDITPETTHLITPVAGTPKHEQLKQQCTERHRRRARRRATQWLNLAADRAWAEREQARRRWPCRRTGSTTAIRRRSGCQKSRACSAALGAIASLAWNSCERSSPRLAIVLAQVFGGRRQVSRRRRGRGGRRSRC